MSHGIDRRQRPHRLQPHHLSIIKSLDRKGFAQHEISRILKTTQSNVSYITRGITHG